MNLRISSVLLYFLLAVITVCTTIMLHANDQPISGSLPFSSTFVSEMPGPDLEHSTIFSATDNRTSGIGSGQFAAVPVDASFGAFTLNDTKISTGGGFMISNPGIGTFDATGGKILSDSPEALVLDLTGEFVPGVSFHDLGPSLAHTTVAFTQRDTSISASFTVEAFGTPIPEPGTFVTMSMGLSGTLLILRRKLLHR